MKISQKTKKNFVEQNNNKLFDMKKKTKKKTIWNKNKTEIKIFLECALIYWYCRVSIVWSNLNFGAQLYGKGSNDRNMKACKIMMMMNLIKNKHLSA